MNTPVVRRLSALVLVSALAIGVGACAATKNALPSGPASPGPTGPAKPSPTGSVTRPAPNNGTWQMMARIPVEIAGAQGVWTGTELILHSPNFTTGSTDVAYTPATNTWRRLASNRYPVAWIEGGSQVVWDGTELLTFGEQNAALNPSTGRWRPLANPPIAGPSVVAWTGSAVLLWGGGCCDSALNAGASYDPVANRWTPMPASPLAGRHAGGVWTGTELIVVGGQAHGTTFFRDAAAYNPVTRSWRMLAPVPAPRINASLIWTGSEILLVGGQANYESAPSADGWAYSLAGNTWRALPAMPLGRTRFCAVWTGQYLIVWGGETRLTGTGPYGEPPHGLIYDPLTRRWLDLPRAPLKARIGAVALWTGDRMLVWGGNLIAGSYAEVFDGATYRP